MKKGHSERQTVLNIGNEADTKMHPLYAENIDDKGRTQCFDNYQVVVTYYKGCKKNEGTDAQAMRKIIVSFLPC